MDHLLLLAIIVLVLLVAIAVVLLAVLTKRLKQPPREEIDPMIEKLAQLTNEAKRRREETARRLETLRETLQVGLRGRAP